MNTRADSAPRIATHPAAMALALSVALWGSSCSREVTNPGPAAPPQYAASPEETQPALRRGQEIARQAFALLSTNLLRAIEQQGLVNALPACSAQAVPLTALVARTNDVALRRVSHKARNPANQADDTERALLARLEKDLAASNPLQPVVIGTGPDTVTFYGPIVITNTLCLKCHGQPEEDIPLENLVTIRRLYPADAAIGFKVGDLRGLWRVDFRREALVGTP